MELMMILENTRFTFLIIWIVSKYPRHEIFWIAILMRKIILRQYLTFLFH
jgi:hypothetical protein